MNSYIDLKRHFRDLTKEELDEPELLAASDDHDFLHGISWSELLECPRVLLLAEAGSGKTREMREKAKELTLGNQYAFFLAIESLHQENLTDVLPSEDEIRFNAWKADGYSRAWFFLDSVDELKLVQGKFENALRKFVKAVDGLLGRVTVIVSCRPSDWLPNSDMTAFKQWLPIVPHSVGTTNDPETTSLEEFLAPLSEISKENPSKSSETQIPNFRTVVLLPMGGKQIEQFASAMNVADASTFVAELNRQNAWDFARRPFDLLELIASWRDLGKLGTRLEQHESNITTKLKENPDRPFQNVLSSQDAQIGAERLALALALTRTRTIRLPDQTLDAHRSEGVLNPDQILADWTDSKLSALLTRGLFDPATYGRVRFHHRSVQEYLAACRLRHLKNKGMTKNSLFRLVFAERYGAEIVFPSMRPIAAWLAHWDADVRIELLKREPETLLTLGDPESLPQAAKEDVLRAFAKRYADSKGHFMNIPLDEVRRLAHPDLDGVIRELWAVKGPTNEDLFELLIELIWKGKSAGCADIAQSVAHNTACEPSNRIVAISALVDSGCDVMARKVADSMLNRPDQWPDKVIHNAVADLFPTIIDVKELIALVEHTPESKSTVGGFSWRLNEISRSLDPNSSRADELRDELTSLLLRGLPPRQESERMTSKFSYVAESLVTLCIEQLRSCDVCTDSKLVQACVVASKFNYDSYESPKNSDELENEIARHPELRESIFWKQLDIRDNWDESVNLDDWSRYYFIREAGLLARLDGSDKPWLEKALTNVEQPRYRGVALQALLDIRHAEPFTEAYFTFLKTAIRDNQELADVLQMSTESSNKSQSQLAKWQSKKLANEVAAEKRQEVIRADWVKWREALLACPDQAFNDEKADDTLSSLFNWLKARHRKHGHRGAVWNRQVLTRVFGSEVTVCAARGFSSFWRKQSPQLLSERAVPERNVIYGSTILALCGLAAESETKNWAYQLTFDEAKLAAKFSCLELNVFSTWLVDLILAKPAEVKSVLGDELKSEFLRSPQHQHLPILQNLTHAARKIKEVLTPHCIELLLSWAPQSKDQVTTVYAAHHLDQLAQVLSETVGDEDRQKIADYCQTRFAQDPDGALAREWLKALFKFDFALAAEALIARLQQSTESDAITLLAFLFGDRRGFDLTPMAPAKRAATLGKLVRVAYKIVKLEDDQPHEGVYTPRVRDHAEMARSSLLNALIQTSGLTTYKELRALTEEAAFAKQPNRLMLITRELAARDAEFEAFKPSDITAMDSHLEAPAHDRDSLFAVMLNRLEDLQHDFSDGEFSTRRLLQTISQEIDMQLQVAEALRLRSNGVYIVSREAEVADLKKPDIQIAAVRGDQKAAIEIKLADNWTVAELEHALEHQLLAQYLRDSRSKAGCLLITNSGKKKTWHHKPLNKRLDFLSLISHLQKLATEIEAKRSGDARVAVFGLDLRDPRLVPAYKTRKATS